MARKDRSQGCEMDMTPMIDIVFQLIIFFVVTLKMTKDFNKDIQLEDGKHGPPITSEDYDPKRAPFEIELDKKGNITIANLALSDATLRTLLRNRVSRMGADFPLLIRADKNTPHSHVKRIMDICTEEKIWKLSFVAMYDPKSKNNRK